MSSSSQENPFVVQARSPMVKTPRELTAESLARQQQLTSPSSSRKVGKGLSAEYVTGSKPRLLSEADLRHKTPTRQLSSQAPDSSIPGDSYVDHIHDTASSSAKQQLWRKKGLESPAGPFLSRSPSSTAFEEIISSSENTRIERIIPKEAAVIQQVAGLGLHLISAEISIPEVVVIGPQSHGKSSVFQELTGLKFPTGQSRTTAFPTAVTVLYSETESLQARIVFAEQCDQSIQHRITAFAEKWLNKSVGLLADIVYEASSIVLKDGELFSENELRISYASPKNDKTAVTYIDLPGLVWTNPERSLVQTICVKHIKRPNVLILNVIQASTDLETSGGEALCKRFDATGKRTYSIATKIDHEVNPWVLEHLQKQLSKPEADIDGPLLFFCRNKCAQENARGISEQEMNALRIRLYSRDPWKNFLTYAGIPSLRSRAVHWIESHCGTAVKDLERFAVDALQDARDEEAALPPAAPEVELEIRLTEIARTRLGQLCLDLKDKVGGLNIPAMISRQEHLNAAVGATRVVRQVRDEITDIVESILNVEHYAAVRALLSECLVRDFQKYDVRIRTVLGLNPAVQNTIAQDVELKQALTRLIMCEVVSPFFDKFSRTISERILSNYTLTSSLLTGIVIVDDPITIQRRDLKRRIDIFEQVEDIMRKYRRN